MAGKGFYLHVISGEESVCMKIEEQSSILEDDIQNKIIRSIDPSKAAVQYLFDKFDYYDWVGIYVLCENELVLGPYRGPPTPHTRIPVDKGICGAAVREERLINLADVWSDERFIACSTTTRSELVVPIWLDDKVVAEIDIDSNTPSAFSKRDEVIVEKVAELISPYIPDLAEKLCKK